MFPFLYKNGTFVIQTFSVMLMVASLAATFFAYWYAPKKGLSQIVILDLGIIGTLSAIVGMRLFHVFVENPSFRINNTGPVTNYMEDFKNFFIILKSVIFSHAHFSDLSIPMIFQIWRGGFVSYGAIIALVIADYTYLTVKKLPTWKYGDLLCLVAPLINFFVRIGCLGAGCCYGKQTHFFLHLVFTNRSSEAGQKFYGIPLHPTQIYDLLLNGVVLFLVLLWIDRRKKFDGQVVACFFMIYAIQRAFIEFFRGDVDRGVYFHGLISTAQIMGIAAFVFGLLLYIFLSKKNKPSLS
ncbi:MAG: prolipoprotein diacylglyceryl transferase [Deltaproteobacteria bacterium]|nr:prolipoprotein diacylglyceryl transferase [Deltaproteobacteria bacterium]